jgi:N6-adenosine-specific RNA methylase IME4
MSAALICLASIPAAMKALDKLEAEIAAAPTFEVLTDLVNKSAGFQRRWKPVKEVADRAGECWISALLKLDAELASIPKATGTRSQLVARGVIGGTKMEPPIIDAPTLAEIGVDRKEAARAHKLGELPEEKRAALIGELKTEGKAVNPTSLLAKKRAENKATKKHKIATAAFSANGPFDCVVIDPPWAMQKIDRDVRPNQDAFAYPVMTEEELLPFWPVEIAPKLSDDCHVFCWTTQRFLPAALRLMEAWALKYVLTMVWYKTGGFQPIGLPQFNCEFVIYGRKGTPVFVDTKNFACGFTAPRREHSRKPDEFYDLVRRVTGGSRIDVFSREPREGFSQFGNETERFAKLLGA